MFIPQRFGIGEKVKNIGPVISQVKKKWSRKNSVVASMEGLECPKRAENVINRELSHFYIEAIPNFFFQLPKIIFRRSIEKKSKTKVDIFSKSEKRHFFQ